MLIQVPVSVFLKASSFEQPKSYWGNLSIFGWIFLVYKVLSVHKRGHMAQILSQAKLLQKWDWILGYISSYLVCFSQNKIAPIPPYLIF